jgi:hypothetical protein|tara:strand:+ start:1148 stop:1621 length:474 start_codon:yes stop_codon:yes gene_type:complete
MSTYYNFLSKVQKYLKTVRILDTHVSYDLMFSNKWVLPRNMGKGIEVVKNGIDGDKISLSFVCPIHETSVNQVEDFIDNVVKSNLEREEKDKLFRNKVQELKSIFEKENLSDLKNLKFDVDELTSIINSNGEKSDQSGIGEGTTSTEIRQEEVGKTS